MSYSHLQTATGQPAAAGAAGSIASLTDRSDVSRQRQLAVDDDAEVTSCVLRPGLLRTTTERARL